MNRRLAVKLMIDLGLSLAMILALAYRLTGTEAHEIIGLGAFMLLAAHNLINRRWYKNMRLAGGGAERQVNRAVTLILLALAAVLLVTGVLSSHVLFSFIRADNGFLMRQIHTLTAYWLLVLMSVHVGFHWNLIMAVAARIIKPRRTGLWSPALIRLSSLAAMVGGVRASFNRDLGSKLLMRHSFDYWDGGPAGFFITCLLIMILYAGLTYYSLKICRRFRLKKIDRAARRNRQSEESCLN